MVEIVLVPFSRIELYKKKPQAWECCGAVFYLGMPLSIVAEQTVSDNAVEARDLTGDFYYTIKNILNR
jgi:hypothetical protein